MKVGDKRGRAVLGRNGWFVPAAGNMVMGKRLASVMGRRVSFAQMTAERAERDAWGDRIKAAGSYEEYLAATRSAK